MTKKKDPKKEQPQKDKKPEHPQRSKHKPAKKTPSRVYRGKSKESKDATLQRRRAVDRAAAQLRRFAIPFDKGDSIIICTRHKVVLAFDHPESAMEGLRKDASISGSVLVHFDANTFKHTQLFDAMVIEAIDRKPVYAGKKGGMIPPVKVPDLNAKVKQGKPKPHIVIEKAKDIKGAVKKLSQRQNKTARTKKVEKISPRRLTR
jgi:hypothetical protein